MKRKWQEIGHLDFVLPTKTSVKKWLLNFHLFAIKIWRNHTYHDRFGDENAMPNELGIITTKLKYNKIHIILASDNATGMVFRDKEILIGSSKPK